MRVLPKTTISDQTHTNNLDQRVSKVKEALSELEREESQENQEKVEKEAATAAASAEAERSQPEKEVPLLVRRRKMPTKTMDSLLSETPRKESGSKETMILPVMVSKTASDPEEEEAEATEVISAEAEVTEVASREAVQ